MDIGVPTRTQATISSKYSVMNGSTAAVEHIVTRHMLKSVVEGWAGNLSKLWAKGTTGVEHLEYANHIPFQWFIVKSLKLALGDLWQDSNGLEGDILSIFIEEFPTFKARILAYVQFVQDVKTLARINGLTVERAGDESQIYILPRITSADGEIVYEGST